MSSSSEVSWSRFGTVCYIGHGSSTLLNVHLSQSSHASEAFTLGVDCNCMFSCNRKNCTFQVAFYFLSISKNMGIR